MTLLSFQTISAILLVILSFHEVSCDSHHHSHDHEHTDLHEKYNFKVVLHQDEADIYTLHWKFDVESETISFAVNVSTTGWVGFGLSPNGGMVNSDIMIGWVTDSGEIRITDRYADAESTPSLDGQQDWVLEGGEEVPGWTILEFSRKWVTCDSRDRNIEAVTARVIYSWHADDPVDGQFFSQHQMRGVVSLNLIGGLQNPPPDPPNLKSFTIAADNVTIPPVDTTYWCLKYKMPEEVLQDTQYVTKYTTVITPGAESFVHHMLIYLCPFNNKEGEEEEEVNAGNCEAENEEETTQIHRETEKCRHGILIAAWAIGGEDFIYPEDVAYPIGGEGRPQYLLLELHYDNPKLMEGVRDSSGITFFYTSERRKHDAAIATIGHEIKPSMIIPPNADQYIIAAECSADCTTQFFPESGIKIFANFLHTHLVGKEVELRHFRYNKACRGYQELEPIEKNPTYDFDYQQTNFLPHEITVLPGDIVVLKCTYSTVGGKSARSNVTLGGFSTTREMCLSFPTYYPATAMGICGSRPKDWPSLFAEFADAHVPSDHHGAIKALNDESKPSDFESAFYGPFWSKGAVDGLQDLTDTGVRTKYCYDSVKEKFNATFSQHVTPKCPFVQDICSSDGELGLQTDASFIHIIILCYFMYNMLAFMTYIY